MILLRYATVALSYFDVFYDGIVSVIQGKSETSNIIALKVVRGGNFSNEMRNFYETN